MTPAEKAAKYPKSLRAAINHMCYQCMGGDGADPGWRKSIGNCTAPHCALWPHRPYQHMNENDK